MLTRLQTVAMTIALNCFDHRNVARCCTSRTTVATQLWNTMLFNQPTRLQANQAYWTNHTVHFNQANCHAISAAPHTEASYLADIWSRFAQGKTSARHVTPVTPLHHTGLSYLADFPTTNWPPRQGSQSGQNLLQLKPCKVCPANGAVSKEQKTLVTTYMFIMWTTLSEVWAASRKT
jgi:hypothetical protein